MIADAERKLARAQDRDALQAERPPGCWCLGLGGRGGHQATLPEGDEPVHLYAETCPACPEGAAAAAAIAAFWPAYWFQTLHEPDRLHRLEAAIEMTPAEAAYTLDNFPVSPLTRPLLAAGRAWAAGGDFSILACGPASRGKTAVLLAALHTRVLAEGRAGWYVPAPLLIEQMRHEGLHKREYEGKRTAYERATTVPYLLLDDLGKDKVTEFTDQKLYEVIALRKANDMRTLYTSNYDPIELADRIGEWSRDRIIEMCGVENVIEVPEKAPNLRMGERE